MNSDSFLFFRVTAGVFFLLILGAGVMLVKNIEKLVPSNSESDAERSYARFLIFAVWAHAVVLSGGFALFLG